MKTLTLRPVVFVAHLRLLSECVKRVGALVYAAVRCYAMRCAIVRISPYLDLF